MWKYYLLFTFLGLLAAGGASLLKLASSQGKSLKQLIFWDKYFYGGCMAYLLAMLGNIIALKYLPYILAYGLTGLTYIWTAILANIFLRESINKNKILGIALLVLGSLLLGGVQ